MRNLYTKRKKVQALIDLELNLLRQYTKHQKPETKVMLDKIRKMQVEAIDRLKETHG
jgi:adenylosuccinate lyase